MAFRVLQRFQGRAASEKLTTGIHPTLCHALIANGGNGQGCDTGVSFRHHLAIPFARGVLVSSKIVILLDCRDSSMTAAGCLCDRL